MKTDAVVLGAELDALVAVLRLRELGHSVRILNAGAGSLHYAPGGIHVLGYTSDVDSEPVPSPLARIEDLDERHPYQIAGAQATAQALDWFFETSAAMDINFRRDGDNITAIAPSGCPMPIYGPAEHQATRDATDTKNIAVVRFRGHRDFPAGLVVNALSERGCVATVVDVDGPLQKTDTVTLANAFDVTADSYFAALKSRLPNGTEIVVFPAVLGLRRHRSVIRAAEDCLGVRCLELPTLPPSVPGMRLHHALETRLSQDNVPIHTGARFKGAHTEIGRCNAVVDSMGRAHEGSVFVIATGGVLMGGLQVESSGQIRETAIGLDVFQSRPLEGDTVDQSLDALHRAGVETDSHLRAKGNGSRQFSNVFITGRTLAHWNPASEISAEGVSIVTGWLAAQTAHDYLRG